MWLVFDFYCILGRNRYFLIAMKSGCDLANHLEEFATLESFNK